MADQDAPPVIIIRKKKAHHGHHGGAWKVAYADFVTAMMALFIVLWLLSSDDKVKKAVGGYFQDPLGTGKMMGSTYAGSGESLALSRDDMSSLKEKLTDAMRKAPDFQKLKENIQITVTGEGLRVELLEKEGGMFFESGNAKPTGQGQDLLTRLAAELGKLPNRIVMEGHTDAKPFAGDGTYTNWELSADRANAARRLMMQHGLRGDQVGQVRGFADQKLRAPKEPESPSNRRISVIVQYLTPPEAHEKPRVEGAAGQPGPAGHEPPAAAKEGGGAHGAKH